MSNISTKVKIHSICYFLCVLDTIVVLAEVVCKYFFASSFDLVSLWGQRIIFCSLTVGVLLTGYLYSKIKRNTIFKTCLLLMAVIIIVCTYLLWS